MPYLSAKILFNNCSVYRVRVVVYATGADSHGPGPIDSEEKMGVESVQAYFREQGLEYEIHEFAESTETVELAARALGVEPALIAKTLAFKVRENGVLVVTKGDARIENRKFKDQFGVKAKMMSAEEVLEKPGHPVGGRGVPLRPEPRHRDLSRCEL
jgi:hypothetical protein